MRYVIADLNGRSHAYFDLRGEARDALREIEDDDPTMIDELYVVAYEDGEMVWGPEPAVAVLGSQDLDWSGVARSSFLTTEALAQIVSPFTPPATRLRDAAVGTRSPAVPA